VRPGAQSTMGKRQTMDDATIKAKSREPTAGTCETRHNLEGGLRVCTIGRR
jgi:hypothetical protein